MGSEMCIRDRTCPVTTLVEILGYLDRENAQQCGPCFRGIPAMLTAAEAVADGTASPEDLERLKHLATTLRGRGACGTLDAACGFVDSLLQHRRVSVVRHLEMPCPSCARREPHTAPTQFAIPWPIQLEELR